MSDASHVLKISTQKELRAYLKEKLRIKGMTLKKMSEMCSLNPSTLQRFVSDEGDTGTISFEKACDIIDKICGGYIALPSGDGYLIKEEVIELREQVKALEFKLQTQDKLISNYELMVKILNSKMELPA